MADGSREAKLPQAHSYGLMQCRGRSTTIVATALARRSRIIKTVTHQQALQHTLHTWLSHQQLLHVQAMSRV